jgi:hypothetical protein
MIVFDALTTVVAEGEFCPLCLSSTLGIKSDECAGEFARPENWQRWHACPRKRVARKQQPKILYE